MILIQSNMKQPDVKIGCCGLKVCGKVNKKRIKTMTLGCLVPELLRHKVFEKCSMCRSTLRRNLYKLTKIFNDVLSKYLKNGLGDLYETL